MWCHDGFFLVREVLVECYDFVMERVSDLPEWAADFPQAHEFVSSHIGKRRMQERHKFCDLPPLEHRYKENSNWADLIDEAVINWLMGRFFYLERYRLFLAISPEVCIRVSSETAFFSAGSLSDAYQESEEFPQSPEAIVNLAIWGLPASRHFKPSSYFLGMHHEPKEARTIYDLSDMSLYPFANAPLTWKATENLDPKGVLSKIFEKSSFYTKIRQNGEPASARSIYRQILEHSKSGLPKKKIRDYFPQLSSRKFDMHWRKASEVNPLISLPGRKS
jgi:hypothetical protein